MSRIDNCNKENKIKENGLMVFHPSKIMGGTEILILRAIVLLKDKYEKIYVVDYGDGALAKEIIDDDIIFIDIDNYSSWIYLLQSNKLFISARNIARIIFLASKYKVQSIDMFAWILHPSELYSGYVLGTSLVKRKFGYLGLLVYLRLIPGFKSYRRMLEQLIYNENIIFMDMACFREVSWAFNKEFHNAKYLSLITNLNENKVGADGSNPSVEYLVISRIEDFKTPGIIKLINDLGHYLMTTETFGKLHIIGDGKDVDIVKQAVDVFNQYLQVVFHGYIYNSGFDVFFLEHNISILFAMGTSALEGLSRGVVTILLPCSDREINCRDNVYKIMHRQNSNSLGEYIGTPYESDGYLTLSDAISQIGCIGKRVIENEVFDYFYKNYSKQSTELNLIKAISSNRRLDLEEISPSLLMVKYSSFIHYRRKKKWL